MIREPARQETRLPPVEIPELAVYTHEVHTLRERQHEKLAPWIAV